MSLYGVTFNSIFSELGIIFHGAISPALFFLPSKNESEIDEL
jgi:hypothetical protein